MVINQHFTFDEFGDERQFRRLESHELDIFERRHGPVAGEAFEDWLRGGGADLILNTTAIDGRSVDDWGHPDWRWPHAGIVALESKKRSQ